MTRSTRAEIQRRKKTFDGRSDDLKATQVVPTLEAAVEEGKNAIWCSSFLAAWKTLAADIVREDVSLDGSPEPAVSLNKAEDPRPHAPTGAMYAAAGWVQQGIVTKICEELARTFPGKPSPTFPGLAEDAVVAYSYLEANVKFALPYFQSRKPLEFTDSQGRKTKVTSFGIRPEDDYAYYQLRSQPRILFRKGNPGDEDLEFAIDLDARSLPSQIIVARIKREPTLAAALRRIEREEAELQKLIKGDRGYGRYLEAVGPNDVLLVPDLFWQISRRFSELEGRSFENPTLKGQHLEVAQQDILFRLDRSGAELKSEAKMVCLPIPTYFVLDRPFLICMKKRGAPVPYFVMWVSNAELLTRWTKGAFPSFR
ncbi:MAG: hypothetical protein ACYTEQ_29100 [Planctomycetota bacterium]|jgi:hypothetical protein